MLLNNATSFSNKKYSTQNFVKNLINLPNNLNSLINSAGKIEQQLIPQSNNWNSEKVYEKNQIVFYNDQFYYSLIDNNTNNVPEENSQYWVNFVQYLHQQKFYEFTSSNVTSENKIYVNTSNAVLGIIDENNMFWNLLPETVFYLQKGIEIDLSGILALKNDINISGTWKIVLNGFNNQGFVFTEEDPIYRADKPNIVFKQRIKAKIIDFPVLIDQGEYKSYTFDGIYDLQILDDNGNQIKPNVYQRLLNDNKTIIKFIKTTELSSSFKIILKEIFL